MHEAAAVSALAMTVSLTLRRPRLPSGIRIGPALAAGLGVLILVAAGDLHAQDARQAVDILWRPFLALASIMVMTGVASRVGAMDQLARRVVPSDGASAKRLFGLVFLLSLGTAAVLNNDAAILLLTPVVVLLVRRLYPDTPSLVLPFAFAVFMAAGVAPFVTSNPMNTVVAGAAGIDFNTYASRMLPVALAGSVVTFLVLRRVFAGELAEAAASPPESDPPAWTDAQRRALIVVLSVLAAYPVFALFGFQVYVVALAGAALALAVAWRHEEGRPLELVRGSVAWEVLAFLAGMFLLAQGLQNVGVVDRLTDLYRDTGIAVIGVTSALGSALVNNHSMALTNLLAIQDLPAAGDRDFLAALVGGDLGPRLLPIGSLAGLLWIAVLAKLDVEVPLKRFVVIGAAVTVPSLAVSLGTLELLSL
jgi:arsenical pump membrane protein